MPYPNDIAILPYYCLVGRKLIYPLKAFCVSRVYKKANWQHLKGNCRVSCRSSEWESCTVRPAARGVSHEAWGKLKGALLPRHGQQIRRLNCLSSQDANWKIHQRAPLLSMRLIDWQADSPPPPPPSGYMAGLSFPQCLRLRPLPSLATTVLTPRCIATPENALTPLLSSWNHPPSNEAPCRSCSCSTVDMLTDD